MKRQRLAIIAMAAGFLVAALSGGAIRASAATAHWVVLTVVQADGKPANGATVIIHGAPSAKPIAFVHTNEWGTSRFDLPDMNEHYCIVAHYQGASSAPACYRAHEYPSKITLTVR